MSFDPITLALAKKYTDEKAGGGGSGASQKMIDLTKYVLEEGSEKVTFNDLVLNIFAQGGSAATATGDSAFWNDVTTDSPLLFVIDAAAISPGIKIEAGTNSVTKWNGATSAIELSFLVNVGGWSKVTVVFGDNGNGTTTITVVAEPLTTLG